MMSALTMTTTLTNGHHKGTCNGKIETSLNGYRKNGYVKSEPEPCGFVSSAHSYSISSDIKISIYGPHKLSSYNLIFSGSIGQNSKCSDPDIALVVV